MADKSMSPAPHPAVNIDWKCGLEFEGGRPGGPMVRIDGEAKTGPSPFDVLLCAVAACASTDIVTILQKKGLTIGGLSVRVEATRSSEGPRPLASAVLHFAVHGLHVTQEQAQEAVDQSITQYCGVRASLNQRASVRWVVSIHR